MKTLRLLFCLLSFGLVSAQASAQTASEAPTSVAVTTTTLIPFASGVSVHLKNTFGEVHVEGWERDEVEISLRRAAQKKYIPAAHVKEQRRLEKIKIVTSKDASGTLLIETKNIPFLKNNLALEYKVKVPQAIYLKVKHSIGAVHITNIIGDIEATCKIGELVLYVPEKEHYEVDARVKIGEVSSDFGGHYSRQKLLGAKLIEETRRSEPHKLYLRVGIGEVTVKKLAAAQ
jgi:hypothetical protein